MVWSAVGLIVVGPLPLLASPAGEVAVAAADAGPVSPFADIKAVEPPVRKYLDAQSAVDHTRDRWLEIRPEALSSAIAMCHPIVVSRRNTCGHLLDRGVITVNKVIGVLNHSRLVEGGDL